MSPAYYLLALAALGILVVAIGGKIERRKAKLKEPIRSRESWD